MSRIVTWKPKYDEYWQPVNPRLSVSPKDMELMTAQGRAVSVSSMENFIFYNGDQLDGLPLDMQRGQDMNSIWEAEQVARHKVRNLAHKRSRELHDMEMRQKGGAEGAGI